MIQNVSSQSITVDVQSAATAHSGLVDLVQATTFGSDGLLYQRLDVQSQLDRFNAPVYFHAIANKELLGVYVLDRRQLLVGDERVAGYYRGVLAVGAQWQGRGVGKALTLAARQWLSNQSGELPAMSYGCIDQGNRRSLTLLESGGATIGPALSMYMMYRQWPAVCCELLPLESRHLDQIGVLKDELYGQCRVRDVTPSRLPGYVLHDEAGVAVSARVADTSFQITSMSTAATWCTRLFVKPFASARRRFNPGCFRYISFSQVVIRPGCERQWGRFVSTVLARNNCHFAVVYVDPQSELFTRLQKSHPINRWLHSSTGGIRVLWQTFGQSELRVVEQGGELSPLQLWPVDA